MIKNFYKITALITICMITNTANAKCLAVNIQGVSNSLQRLIHNNLKIHQQQLKQSSHRSQEIKKIINDTLQTRGYFNASVNNTMQTIKKCDLVKSQIILGPATNFKQIKLSYSHKNQLKTAAILKTIPAKPNTQFSSSSYNQSLNQILRTAHLNGYLYANTSKSRLIINPKNQTAKAYYHLTLNQKITIAKPIIINNPLTAKLVYKLINYQPNKPFSVDWAEQAQINLMNSGYFTTSDVQQHINKTHKEKVPITIKLSPVTKTQKAISLGYDTDTLFRVLFGLRAPIVNKLGHQFQASSTVGEKERNINFSYIIPGPEPAKDSWSITSQYENYLDLNFATTSFWAHSFNYNYLDSNFMSHLSLNTRAEHSFYLNSYTQKSTIIYPEYQGYKTINLRSLAPTKNAKIKLQWLFRLANQKKSSSSWFKQYLIQLLYKLPLTQKHSIVLNISDGKIITKDISSVPLSLQFSAGGGQSLRGYLFNELGPSKTIDTISFEYLYKFSGPWHIGSFIDSAYINSQWGKKWFKGIGLSLSWHADLANIGISIARAMSLPKRPFRLQLSVMI